MATIIYSFPKTGTRTAKVPVAVMASHLRSIERNGGVVIQVVV